MQKPRPYLLWFRPFRRAKLWALILALITTSLIFGLHYLNQTVVYRGGATGEELQRIKERNEELEKKLNEDEEKKDNLRKLLFKHCASQRNPNICREIAEAGIRIETALDFPGLAAFAVALGKTEQNYSLTPCTRDLNCFGMGSFNSHTWKVYPSFDAAIIDIARLLKRFGYKEVRPQDVDNISRFYKGVPPYAHWVALIRSIMEGVI